MRKLIGCLSILSVAIVVNCGSPSTEDGEGGTAGGGSGGAGGEGVGGKGGTASGGKGGAGTGGSGGTAAGGKGGTGGGGTGGTGGSGGTGGTGGSGGAQGGAGGTAPACAVVPTAKLIEFETDADLWRASYNLASATNLRVPAPMPVLSTTTKRSKTKSLELVVNTADGLPVTQTDGGAVDAGGTDAGSSGVVRTQWFFMVNDRSAVTGYLQAGRTISLWILVPTGHKLSQMSLVLHTASGWKSTNALAAMVPGQWSKVSFTIPNDYDCSRVSATNLFELGLFMQVTAGQTWNGKIYVDDMEVSAKP